ncbi:hypothetical protein HPP92_017327 [Vanilla planifolia]|uniref:Auxin-responsive protein n=1 Tax=Vanilla planifolia TaxID=51239 RepID=A0A835QKM9_VANPL|nr:hypothetical protein HPP92_017327 [Vanilla planifolia]
MELELGLALPSLGFDLNESVATSGNDDGRGEGRDEESEEWRRGTWVKVRMEGVAIGRKLDLCPLRSYEQLFHALYCFFFQQLDEEKGLPEHRQFRVSYEDWDGNWMKVGDIPWREFVQSVKRLLVVPELNR